MKAIPFTLLSLFLSRGLRAANSIPRLSPLPAQVEVLDGTWKFYMRTTLAALTYLLTLSLVATAVQAQAITVEETASSDEAIFDQALMNGTLANEGFRRSLHFVEGWKQFADPTTGLIPRNKKDLFWNAKDAAADNYPFMVLTTSFTDRAQFEGRMKEILATEIKLTSRIDRLPDTFDFKSQTLRESSLQSVLFGASEYIKDGLLPLTEWLGRSPWSERMLGMLDDMWKHAPVDTPGGKIVSTDIEVNGEMLQTLSRIYWMTGDKKYLEWVIRLGDYYLLGNQHPTRNLTKLRLRDHGCEVVSGLCELYATVHYAAPDKKKAYAPHIHEMLDRILEVGRNEDGLFFDEINPVEGTVIKKSLADTWGYNLNGFYTVYLVDQTEAYREATIKALSNLGRYTNYRWEANKSDGYADSIESALNLYNRERVESVPGWLDSEIQVMWAKQQDDGVIEGWHGDGNFARTSIMYCLWKSKGASIQPWREDVMLGAVEKDEKLYLTLTAKEDWSGQLIFDTARHKTNMNMPLDWPRINQFPEWFTVEAESRFLLTDARSGKSTTYTGEELSRGIEMTLEAGAEMHLIVSIK